MKTIEIDGIKYKLVQIEELREPIGEDLESAPALEEEPEDSSPEEESTVTADGVPDAKGKLSTYREKFKERKLTPTDFAPLPSKTRRGILHQPGQGDMDQLDKQAGYGAFFGDGVTVG